MKLLAISSPDFIPDEARIINGLFRTGLEYIHIRKPECTLDQLRVLLDEIDEEFISRIAVHQHHQVVSEFDIFRLHFTESIREKTNENELKNLKMRGYCLSTSVHDVEEMANLSPYFSYTFFGPVFDSISKSGYKSLLAKDFYLEKKYKTVPVIGLGGITISNQQQVKDMNFDGAAILGILWQEPSKAIEVFTSLANAIKS